jgi:autotransporter family porin
LTKSTGPTIGIAGSGNATLRDSRVEGSGQWLRVGIATEFPLLSAIESPQFDLPEPNNPGAPAPGAPPSPSGPIITPGLANVILSGSTAVGSAFTASGSVSNLTMINDSLWTMTGNSNITNLANNHSLIQYTLPSSDSNLLSSYKMLITQNYVGNNDFIDLNTFLGSDSSPSDILVIDGGTGSGSTGLHIQNTIGQGALTLNNGIL